MNNKLTPIHERNAPIVSRIVIFSLKKKYEIGSISIGLVLEIVETIPIFVCFIASIKVQIPTVDIIVAQNIANKTFLLKIASFTTLHSPLKVMYIMKQMKAGIILVSVTE